MKKIVAAAVVVLCVVSGALLLFLNIPSEDSPSLSLQSSIQSNLLNTESDIQDGPERDLAPHFHYQGRLYWNMTDSPEYVTQMQIPEGYVYIGKVQYRESCLSGGSDHGNEGDLDLYGTNGDCDVYMDQDGIFAYMDNGRGMFYKYEFIEP